jgi:hypothetical protein
LIPGVFGRVTKRSLRNEMGISAVSEQYGVGDVVSCKVVQVKKKMNDKDVSSLNVNEEDFRPYHEITLSLRESDDNDVTSNLQNEVHISTGAVLPAKALRVLELVPGKTKEDSFVPGYAIVEVRAKDVMQGSLESKMVECKLPFDQLFDNYESDWLTSPQRLHKIAKKILVVGEKINQKSILLTDPKKSSVEFVSGTGRLTVVSLRPQLIELVERGKETDPKVPGPDTEIFVGAKVAGYVCQIDQRFGAFVRFFDGLTGLVPKLKGGAELPLFETVKATVIAIDVSKKPPKILLGKARSLTAKGTKEFVQLPFGSSCAVDDIVSDAEVTDVESLQVTAQSRSLPANHQIRIHCTMAPFDKTKHSVTSTESKKVETNFHFFRHWNAGMKLPPLKVVSVKKVGQVIRVDVQLTALTSANKYTDVIPEVLNIQKLSRGQKVTGIVGDTGDNENKGVWVMLGPNLSGFLYSHELSENEDDLDRVSKIYPKGTRVACIVADVVHGRNRRIHLSLCTGKDHTPAAGDVVMGRINHKHHGLVKDSVALYVDIKGGFTGRGCITELYDHDEWTNQPLSAAHWDTHSDETKKK